jgi:hypothetical protein
MLNKEFHEHPIIASSDENKLVVSKLLDYYALVYVLVAYKSGQPLFDTERTGQNLDSITASYSRAE